MACAECITAESTLQSGHIDQVEFVFRLFRRQHLEKSVPGLEKLGLTSEPHAAAAAKYHYSSSQLGGVKVEYLDERPDKAWVRYPLPRWIWIAACPCSRPASSISNRDRGNHASPGGRFPSKSDR